MSSVVKVHSSPTACAHSADLEKVDKLHSMSSQSSELLWSTQEGQRASRQIKRLRRQTFCAFSMAAVMSAAVIGVTTWGIELSDGIHSESHNLVDADGHVVGTSQHRDVVGGIKASPGRRLTDVTVQEAMYDTYEMDPDAFQKAFNQYVGGKAEWIAEIGNGMLRTIQVLGAASGGAWGSCSSADHDLEWHVTCPGALEQTTTTAPPNNETDNSSTNNDTDTSSSNISFGACVITTNLRSAASDNVRLLSSRRLGSPQSSQALADLSQGLAAEKRAAVISFFTSQQLFTVEDLASTSADELSQAFPALDGTFTLGFRASAKEMLALAQRQWRNSRDAVPHERALEGKGDY